MLAKPYKSKLMPEHDTVMLYFKPEDNNGLNQAEYYVRGGIVWPRGMIGGYGIVAAQTLTTKIITIYAQFEFSTIETRFVGDTQTRVKGANEYFEEMWEKYGCDTYFTSARDKELHRRFDTKMFRDSFLKVQPHIIKTRYGDKEENIDPIIVEYIRSRKIKYDGTSLLHKQLLDFKKMGGLVIDENKIALVALRHLIAGIEKFPFEFPTYEE
ncbi:MAG: hypothetical protein GY853_13285 [PVC group bacterium]|nr:hypothetical protein [PVC group bacterium]